MGAIRTCPELQLDPAGFVQPYTGRDDLRVELLGMARDLHDGRIELGNHTR